MINYFLYLSNKLYIFNIENLPKQNIVEWMNREFFVSVKLEKKIYTNSDFVIVTSSVILFEMMIALNN